MISKYSCERISLNGSNTTKIESNAVSLLVSFIHKILDLKASIAQPCFGHLFYPTLFLAYPFHVRLSTLLKSRQIERIRLGQYLALPIFEVHYEIIRPITRTVRSPTSWA